MEETELNHEHKSTLISLICQVAVIEHQLKELASEQLYGSCLDSSLHHSALEANTLKVKLSNHLID